MTTRRALPFVLSLLALPALPARAADVGEIVLVRNLVRGTAPGAAARPLTVGEGVALGLRVETGADSGTKMTFDPSGSLTIGANTRATIDKNVVDRATGRSDSVLSVLAGTVRLALGRLFSGEVAVDTPTAVVGVKGTDFRVEVEEATGTTLVFVTEGEVTVRSKAGGEVTVRAGQRTLVAPGQAPTPPSLIEPGATTLTASAGGPIFTPPPFLETPLFRDPGAQIGLDFGQGEIFFVPLSRIPPFGAPGR